MSYLKNYQLQSNVVSSCILILITTLNSFAKHKSGLWTISLVMWMFHNRIYKSMNFVVKTKNLCNVRGVMLCMYKFSCLYWVFINYSVNIFKNYRFPIRIYMYFQIGYYWNYWLWKRRKKFFIQHLKISVNMFSFF